MDESPKKLLRVLKNGGMIGILADQDVDSVDGVFVKFFGHDAFTPVAPVKIALATGAKIVPAFVVRKSDNSYRFVAEKPMTLSSSGDKEADVKRYTQEWTDTLEKHIRKDPEQWVWVHKRWKTKND